MAELRTNMLHDYQDSKGRFVKGHKANEIRGANRGISVKRTQEEAEALARRSARSLERSDEEIRVRGALSENRGLYNSPNAMRIRTVFSLEEAKPLRSTVLAYIENGFQQDFMSLEPERRLYYFEKLLPFFLPKATPDINITTENSTIVASDMMNRFFQSTTQTRKVQDIPAEDITNKDK